MENPFHLYDSDPDAVAKANEDIYSAISRASQQGDLEQAWQEIVLPVLSHHEKVGASDTYSRDVVWEYLKAEHLEVANDVYPERREKPQEPKTFYYVVYPDPLSDKKIGMFPSDLGWEGFGSVDEARQRAKELDKGHPPRDFVVIKGTVVGFVSGDAYDAEFLDG